jgi:DNA-directed RNA polymerase subunit RPC12/RpoP
MKCARCGAEVTNKIIKINGVIYCENCVKELGYDRFLKNPEELLGAAFSPLD